MFFMKGNDDRLLSTTQAMEIDEFIRNSKPSTSCFVYNSAEALRKLRNWEQTFPWIKPHYAIKSNPSLSLLKDVLEFGAGFDCASRAEIETVLQIGAERGSIVYSNPVKDE
jgi:ornithine decarboxylase